ncbi:class I SAM-dependent methyltransferase [Algoriphagus sp. CAU 1675]|uniref:O-methyltransferase n=1 Tax=Algoriphagus sp. CAU 1675 TaxID=3032597 RepID=UPI0023DCA839|nr:class I SAM-dependent methyltransferase [Algoriphagus sp. CAU 1675]MDF2157439.1 class I SAM-dependent methyltransferase [Algoriphagus sp. CAU 1675]
MLSRVYPFLAYLKYWLLKEDHYSLQSPFLFQLYQNLKKFRRERQSDDLEIEQFRESLLKNTLEIEIQDLGAGSKRVPQRIRRISKVARFSTSPRKYAQLYQYFCSLTPAKTVLELGTCVGITTRYLGKVTKGKIFSFEGSTNLITVAKKSLKSSHIEFIQGNIHQTLPSFLSQTTTVDFALIDANHTFDSTVAFFELLLPKIDSGSIITIGDIHWSSEMNKAWDQIKKHPKVSLSLDFFECGILLFHHSEEKAHFVLDY